jgi:pilus assembly protein CpaB
LFAFLMAALLAGTMTYFFTKRVQLSRAQHATTGIVAAVNDLPSGATLTAKDVEMVAWPTNLALAGSFDKIDDVVGKPLLYPLVAREPILKRDLGVEGSGIGISGKIPTGMRATAVRSNEIVGVAGFLYPGSRVDVMATYTPPGSTSGPVTQTVLQNVEVLTAGQTIEPDPQGKPQTVNVVTLLVSPEDSQKLQLASSQGSIQFVLRSGVDQKNVDLHPTRLEQLASLEKPAPLPTKGAPKRVIRKVETAKPLYVLEVIQGTKRTEEKFEGVGEDGK